MITEKEKFLRHNLIPILKVLNSETRGIWGKMNAQQMVEHVTDFFNVSVNRLHFPLVTPEEHLPKYKAFLYSDKEFRENTKAPLEVIGEEPARVRNHNMEEAIKDLENSIDGFFDYFSTHPEKTTLHPAFGHLNYEEWILLHYKHVTHHARQFGVLH